MTDWDRVERLRAKGLDWETIADDEKVGYNAPDGVTDKGRALKGSYLSRRSTGRRSGKGGKGRNGSESSGEAIPKSRMPLVVLIGLIVLIGAGIWALMAKTIGYVAEAPPGVLSLLVGVAIGAVIIGVGLLGGLSPLNDVWKKGLVIGLVVGLVLGGGAGLYELGAGAPNLNTTCDATPPSGGGYCHSQNAIWESNGLPVVFFMGSIACPYCSASSWAIFQAMSAFGSFSGQTPDRSNPGDTYPETPEIALDDATYTSNFVQFNIEEGNDDNSITIPSLSVHENALAETYDSGGSIPFFTIGDRFIHSGSFVNPGVFHPNGTDSDGISYSEAQAEMADQSSAVYQGVEPVALWLEAYVAVIVLEAGNTLPPSVTTNPTVESYITQIEAAI